MKSFSSFHPSILLVYYLSIMTITICTLNPVVIGSSLLGSLLFFTLLSPLRFIVKELTFYFFVFLFIAITTLLFVHNGETILFFMNDNPITYEAAIYGIVLAILFIAIAFWNKSYSDILSSDKIIYLFGNSIPRLGVFISMLFRIIPIFKKQFTKVNKAQKALGFYTSESMTDRLFGSIRVFKSTFIWALEDTFSKSDSMKARGYGLKGRSNFSIFKWQKRDTWLLIFLLVLVMIFIVTYKSFYFYYFPTIAKFKSTAILSLRYFCVGLLMIIPSMIEVKENLQWNYLKSRI